MVVEESRSGKLARLVQSVSTKMEIWIWILAVLVGSLGREVSDQEVTHEDEEQCVEQQGQPQEDLSLASNFSVESKASKHSCEA